MIERELTYLAKSLPVGWQDLPCDEILDIYLPASIEHPRLRIRKKGDKIEITKKLPIKGQDSSVQNEQTIPLEPEEYKELSQIQGKRTHKFRYHYNWEGYIAEIDVYRGGLEGLVVVDFEFETDEEKNSFIKPDWCLADITQDLFTAGGMLCGKNYIDIETELKRYNYKPLGL